MIARGGMGQTEWRRSAVSLDSGRRKGQRFLLEAAASLKAQGFNFIISWPGTASADRSLKIMRRAWIGR